MSWTARITKAPDGEQRLQFSEPLGHIDMDQATARHLAALLVVASNGASSEPFEQVTTDDVEPKKAVTALNAPRAKNSHESFASDTPQPKTSKTVFKTFMAKNKPFGRRPAAGRLPKGIHCRRTVRRQSTGSVRPAAGRT